jgi:CRP/FNR family cyclic AMP-dependent transcriptional regulator
MMSYEADDPSGVQMAATAQVTSEVVLSMSMVDLEAVFERLSGYPIRTFDKGEILLAEGSRTGQLLFLLQGAVDVVKDGWHIARVDKPGAVFGDMAVLRDQPHSADVIAFQRSSFFIVSDAASFIQSEPLVALYIAAVQSGRLDAANRSLIAAKRQFAGKGLEGRDFLATLGEIEAALHRAI